MCTIQCSCDAKSSFPKQKDCVAPSVLSLRAGTAQHRAWSCNSNWGLQLLLKVTPAKKFVTDVGKDTTTLREKGLECASAAISVGWAYGLTHCLY